MKMSCAPLGFNFKRFGASDMEVILYAQPDMPHRGGVGGSLRNQIIRLKLHPAPQAWDFLTIALSIIAADTGITRAESPDGWTREIDLAVAVSNPALWTSKAGILTEALKFLTTDIWSLQFLGGASHPAPPLAPAVRKEDCVSLLSGGLDSLIGAIDLKMRGKLNPYVVSQVAQGDKERQSSFARQLGLSHLQLNHVANFPWQNERSQRARSVVFLAYAVLAATSLEQYRAGETITLYVCENGFISINPPLTPGRVGSLSTRTTHPVFLSLIQQLLDEVGLRVKIENPYQFMTKGEMLQQCADQKLLIKNAPTSTSCGRFARNGYTHCGRCVPCLIRRASFLQWKQADTTGYVYDDLSKKGNDYAAFDDVRSAGMAIATVNKEGIDPWIGSSLASRFISDVTPYKNTVRRGLKELENFLQSAGVK